MTDRTFTNRGRRRHTRRGVRVAERLARALITVGGVGTILAVTLIFVFLAAVVAPLFLGASTESAGSVELTSGGPLAMAVDPDRKLVWTLEPDGALRLVRLDTGAVVEERRPLGELSPSAFAHQTTGGGVVLGLADGTFRTGRIDFATAFVGEDEARSEGLADLARGAVASWPGGIVERTERDRLRATLFEVEFDEPFATGSTSPIVLLDSTKTPTELRVAALHSDGRLRLYRVRERENRLTGAITRKLAKTLELAIPTDQIESDPHSLLLSGLGQNLYLAMKSGEVIHYDLRDTATAAVAEVVDVVEADAQLTAACFLLGGTTLIAGDSEGRVSAWFPVLFGEDGGEQEPRLVRARDLLDGPAAVSTFAGSKRSRLLAIGFADGHTTLVHATSGDELTVLEATGSVSALAIAPKDDGLMVKSGAQLASYALDPRYPEASFASLFRPVWYEGYPEPQHVWQSSSGTDDFEPKLGLGPLIFGTLKATLYSLIFGAPLALLAAIFTSEFLHSRLRASVKSIIELMASLPSVVLGFLAALVIAPFVREVLPVTLVAFVSMPVTLLLLAHLWQLLPAGVAIRASGWPRLALILLALPFGVGLAILIGPLFEGLLFAGDMEAWLDGQAGCSLGGWFYLLLPISALVVALCSARLVAPRIFRASGNWSRGRVAAVELAKFGAGIAATVGLALGLGWLLDTSGADSRGGVLDTYVQRNALIVGFVMGFAIIPIIYTLAEDALSDVPRHLREASLGAGATQWQTAVRVVVPTAMSGLFSALMIGLGRAVGETMIVLMAAGNTPIMQWNAFNGFRTLSANIAVELPEAVRNSAHYRTLFLAALVLFALTFVLNTLAEAVRRHFREKASAL